MAVSARLAPGCVPLLRERFQSIVDGQATDLFTIANSKGGRKPLSTKGFSDIMQ